MRAITQLALVIAIAIIYIPLAVVALILSPFFEERK
ncbi:phage membrane protein [Streptococcus dysgalactiae]|uniref:Phage membrane protein n=2 Tax=Streptococcus dysgalactiae TaxID=1334 RepID=A0A9X8T441_STREQ|nr:hypothetical protein [Streptococcus dysgalactiae]SUN64357.1 phage membrane protein [Streptococcus dysgalactiae subsp. equisimilis]VGR82493.1 phage membrane protein [Streptococcus pyogenes]SUN71853.1 phage membrane protein [Streptococcus dysgalactiae]VHF09435.1 phage membrane protein [Streptococcus pyogenes]